MGNAIKALPFLVKLVLPIVLVAQLFCLYFKVEIYPFTDVGMFRNRTPNKEYSNIVVYPKHFYYDDADSSVVIADIQGDRYRLRKSFPKVSVPPRRTMYTNIGDPKNFEYLQHLFSPYTNKLFIGIQVYDLAKESENFYTDLDNINRYIPLFQLGRNVFIPAHQER